MTRLVVLDGLDKPYSGVGSQSSSTLPAATCSTSSSSSPHTLSASTSASTSTSSGGGVATSCPSFVTPVDDHASDLLRVVEAILGARRIAVVCGAGISVQAGIPDFRSADGLFQSIKRENPKESLSSGKDLFDAAVFSSEQTTALFCQLMGRLARLSTDACPTPFHELLHELDARGKLMRVYTQNIDALEEKTGLSFGLPQHRNRRVKVKGKGKEKEPLLPVVEALVSESSSTPADASQPFLSDSLVDSSVSSPASNSNSYHHDVPRCIPLHGTLQTMHCVVCTHSEPLGAHLPALLTGSLPDCPACTALASTRATEGKRARSVGKLRPSVVLYNEAHPDGERVGAVVDRDLASLGSGRRAAVAPDLLLVVGTALKVPGTKRIVREFSKGVKVRARAKATRMSERAQARNAALPTPASTPATSPTPSPAPHRGDDSDASVSVVDSSTSGDRENNATGSATKGALETDAITTVYLNLDFPVPTREWEGVFDVWVRGDAQEFADLVRRAFEQADTLRAEKAAEEVRVREERRVREEKRRSERVVREMEREERKREREWKKRKKMEAEKAKVKVKAKSKGTKAKAEKTVADGTTPPAKRRRVSGDMKYLVTPPKTPTCRKLGKLPKGATTSTAKLAHSPHSPTYAILPDHPTIPGFMDPSLPRNSSDSSLSSLSRSSLFPKMDDAGDISETTLSPAFSSTPALVSSNSPKITPKSKLVERQDHRRERLHVHPYPTPPRVVYQGPRSRIEVESEGQQHQREEDQHGTSLDLLASAALSMERVHLDHRGYIAYGTTAHHASTSTELRIEPTTMLMTRMEAESSPSSSSSDSTLISKGFKSRRPFDGSQEYGTADDSDITPLSLSGQQHKGHSVPAMDYRPPIAIQGIAMDSNPVRSRTVVNRLESARSATPTRRIRARVV